MLLTCQIKIKIKFIYELCIINKLERKSIKLNYFFDIHYGKKTKKKKKMASMFCLKMH